MGLYSLDETYGLHTWYEHNGAYDLNAGTDSLLDVTREILESDNYIFQGRTFPKGKDILVGSQMTFSGVLNLQPFSYLVSLTGWSGNDDQFTLRIYDKGAQTDLYFGQFAWFPVVVSNMTDNANNGDFIVAGDEDKPFGPYFFRSPMIILPPGQLQIQVTNLSTPGSPGLELVQLLFGVAVPKNTVTLHRRSVMTSTDQTGTQTLQDLATIIA